MGKATPTGYSAAVKMHLLFAGQSIALTHIGPNFVITAQPTQGVAGAATVMMTIDDEKFSRDVQVIDVTEDGTRLVLAETTDAAPF